MIINIKVGKLNVVMEVMVNYTWKEKIVKEGENMGMKMKGKVRKWWKCPAPGARYMEL